MLEVRGLSKSFPAPKKKDKKAVQEKDPREEGKWFHAVKDVSFDCHRGEILGLLGMNGAGKTTTLRMLATAIKPTAGNASIDGFDVVKDPIEIRRRIGFLSGTTGVYGRLTAREMVAYYGQLNGLSKTQVNQRIDVLSDMLGMGSFLDKRNDNLSTGMKQKVNIARTLVHDPPVIFFDEPTSGLDVLSSRTIVDFILQCKADNKTVVFSTHLMSEVEKLCDRVVVIHQGQNFYDGTSANLKAQTETDDLEDAFLNLVGGKSHG